MQYSSVVSMQDLRTQLANVADRVEQGDRLLVVRNSRPAFMLVPLEGAPQLSDQSQKTWDALEESLDAEPVLSERDVMEIVREVRKRRSCA
jgi:prevent-host-death family protein